MYDPPVHSVEKSRLETGASRRFGIVILLLVFGSGLTALTYQLLWMRGLLLVFGSTAQSISATLAAFFFGLGLGAHIAGKKAADMSKPLQIYALLELCVAASATTYFILINIYESAHLWLLDYAESQSVGLVLWKLGLALALVGPSSFFMGATLPVVAEIYVRSRGELGVRASLLYSINTFGGALGVFFAAFYLPPVLGFNRSYILTLCVSLCLALIAWAANRRFSHLRDRFSLSDNQNRSKKMYSIANGHPKQSVFVLAGLSGFLVLSLEVLWTRMFAQVLQNSVYTYGAILCAFLLALAFGAFIAALLAQQRWNNLKTLSALMMTSGAMVILSPGLFTKVTNNLGYFGNDLSWGAYIAGIFGVAAVSVFPAIVAAGTIFPFLFKVVAKSATGPGTIVGRLSAINIVSSIMGSLIAGFVMLEFIGLWRSIYAMGAVYIIIALYILFLSGKFRSYSSVIMCLIGFVLVLGLTQFDFREVHHHPGEGERLIDVWDGADATVSVIEHNESLKIKVNNYYTLGSSAAAASEQWQAHLPLLLHPNPERIFFIGMGTGITAGASLDHPVKEVVVTELIPDVVKAANKYFQPYLNGLMGDQRVRILTDDGRRALSMENKVFDVVIADLFVPWRKGVGSLYSRDHYRLAYDRLADDGLYIQWLPLFQMSRREFDIILKTMFEVFPQITLWRNDFYVENATVALVGHKKAGPLEPKTINFRISQFRQSGGGIFPFSQYGISNTPAEILHRKAEPAAFLIYYGGNMAAIRDLLKQTPVNTDDRPIIEYLAPVTERRPERRFKGKNLVLMLDKILAHLMPPERDQVLVRWNKREKEFVLAGFAWYLSRVLDEEGEEARAATARKYFENTVTPDSPRVR